MNDLTLLIGHRGVGKTSLLAQLKGAHPGVEVLDLDARIEASAGKTVAKIFSEDGEATFRSWESRELKKIVGQKSDVPRYVALGAGFEAELPAGARVIWVRRETDARGRIFLDRPRLDQKKSALEEYLGRFPAREKRYRDGAWETLTLREGRKNRLSPGAVDFFTDGFQGVGGLLTLLPENFGGNFERFIARRLNWGIALFELRDDLLGDSQIKRALRAIPADRLLFSYRKRPQHFTPPPDEILWDWDLDLGPCPDANPPLLSLHSRKKSEPLADFFARLERGGGPFTHFKAAPIVRDFDELRRGHAWWREDPARRSFLPRSPDARRQRWKWYRLFQKGKMRVNFFREGAGSAFDQPTLLEWTAAVDRADSFAAVLGDPVEHSHTPVEHEHFFARHRKPCFAVPLNDLEWQSGAPEVLRAIGLTHASVTAPLKKRAFDAVAFKSPLATELESVNTIFWDDSVDAWRGTSTDFAGFQALCEGFDLTQEIVVWGGGGVLPIIKKCLPRASYYSSREGRLTAGPGACAPAILIWSAGLGGLEPPDAWAPRHVLDLNYFEDSPGRAYALRCGAKYVSGESMFLRQAAAQREFWEKVGSR